MNYPQITAIPLPTCPYCGALPTHPVTQCPAIVKIEFYPDGTIKVIERRKP